MTRAGRELLRATAVLLVAMALEPLGTAIAAPPNVTITSPPNGSVSSIQTPSFSGLAATQTNLSSETGKSSPVTFTIDTAAPTVTLNAPNSPSDVGAKR